MSDAPDPRITQLLFARAQDGDERALDLLYQRYLDRVRRWSRGRLSAQARSARDTNILAHDVLTRVLLKVGSLRSAHESSFRAYVLTSLRHEIFNANTRAKAAQLDLEAFAKTLRDGAMDPLEATLYQRYDQALRRLYNQLDERDRQLIRLRKIEGRSHREVAELLGFPSVDAARMQCNRVYTTLRDSILELAGWTPLTRPWPAR